LNEGNVVSSEPIVDSGDQSATLLTSPQFGAHGIEADIDLPTTPLNPSKVAYCRHSISRFWGTALFWHDPPPQSV